MMIVTEVLPYRLRDSFKLYENDVAQDKNFFNCGNIDNTSVCVLIITVSMPLAHPQFMWTDLIAPFFGF